MLGMQIKHLMHFHAGTGCLVAGIFLAEAVLEQRLYKSRHASYQIRLALL
jgi:hypothetical protein